MVVEKKMIMKKKDINYFFYKNLVNEKNTIEKLLGKKFRDIKRNKEEY